MEIGTIADVTPQDLDRALATAEAPFGGIRESGSGCEGGALGIQDYLEPKYVKLKF